MDAMTKASLGAAKDAIQAGDWDAHLHELVRLISDRQMLLTHAAFVRAYAVDEGSYEDEPG